MARVAPQRVRIGGQIEVLSFPVLIDFTEGSGGSFCGRPEALLDPVVRAGISMFALLDADVVDRSAAQLAAGGRSHWHREGTEQQPARRNGPPTSPVNRRQLTP